MTNVLLRNPPCDLRQRGYPEPLYQHYNFRHVKVRYSVQMYEKIKNCQCGAKLAEKPETVCLF